MATQAQINANRRNAQRSTGPRTARGKAIACRNAMKHGLRSADVLIPGEDPVEFDQFTYDMCLELETGSSLQEQLLAGRVIRNEWKLRRLPRLEKLATQKLIERGDPSADPHEALLVGILGEGGPALLDKLQRYEQRLAREVRACRKALEARRLQRTAYDVHEAWNRGYNRGVYDEARLREREMPYTNLIPPARPPRAVGEDEADMTDPEILEAERTHPPEFPDDDTLIDFGPAMESPQRTRFDVLDDDDAEEHEQAPVESAERTQSAAPVAAEAGVEAGSQQAEGSAESAERTQSAAPVAAEAGVEAGSAQVEARTESAERTQPDASVAAEAGVEAGSEQAEAPTESAERTQFASAPTRERLWWSRGASASPVGRAPAGAASGVATTHSQIATI